MQVEPTVFTSPLKKVANKRTRPEDSKTRGVSKLRFDNVPQESTLDAYLRKIYNYNFSAPKVDDDVRTFFTVRELVIEIERALSELNNPEVTENCQARIRLLLRNPDIEYKMSEMGMILFYLDTDKFLPDVPCLIAYRAKYIQEEAESYIQNHKPNLPSMEVHFILRAFIHMIFTSSHFYNRCGLICIGYMLKNANYQIAKYLQHEHYDHIICVVNQISSNAYFDNLFINPVKVHESLEDVVRFDLKLKINEDVGSLEVLYTCFLALFTDARQENAPNCYAIAAWIYASENHTYEVLSKMMQWLKEGYCSAGHGSTLPIRPILDKRLANSKDLEVQISVNEFKESFTFQHFCKVMELRSDFVSRIPTTTVRQVLQEVVNRNHVPEISRFVEQMYCCYKQNGLVQMQIALIEFIFINNPERINLNKFEVIKACVDALCQMSPKLSSTISEKLKNRLWLENCSETNFEKIRFHRGSGEALKALITLLETSIRLFSFDSHGNYVLIHSFSDLKSVIDDVVEESIKELTFFSGDLTIEKRKIMRSLGSDAYKMHLAKFCAAQIHNPNITADDLVSLDMFLFDQNGGSEEKSLSLVYGIKTSFHMINSSQTPYVFLENLLNWMKGVDLRQIRNAPKILIGTKNDHVWTLSPSCWNLLLDHKTEFRPFIQATVFNPANVKLDSIVPLKVIREIISRFTGNDDDLRGRMFDIFMGQAFTHRHLRDRLLNGAHKESYKMLANIIDEEFSKISLSLNDLNGIMKFLKIKCSADVGRKILAELPGNEQLPSVFVKRMRKVLIEHGLGIVDPDQIELAICMTKRNPIPISIGDLNWVNRAGEHIHLRIQYCYSSGRPKFYIENIAQSDDDYINFFINHPNLSLNPLWN